MSEFKITGVGYVSEWNGDAANPGTATSPKAHPSDAGMPGTYADVIIIGAGYYTGSIPGGSAARRWTADGEVIIDLQGGDIDPIANNPPSIFTGLTIKNGSLGRIQTAGYQTVNCRLINGNTWKLRFSSIHTGFLLMNDVVNNDSSGAGNFTGCILLGSITGFQALGANQTFISNYLAKGKSIILPTWTSRTNFRNNCINGTIIVSGVSYELKFLFDGSPRPDADPGILDLASIWPDIYTSPRNNFSGDPKFIDEYNRVVSPDSDLLKRSDITTIGSVVAGRKIEKGNSDPDVTITTSQIDTTDPTVWTIQSGFDEGFINFVFKLSDNIVKVPKIFLDSILSFDASVPGGSATNNNVPDIFPNLFNPLSLSGLKPNRLTYNLRTSISISRPVSESQWDNDFASLSTIPGQYYVTGMEIHFS
jgi:hypothetical protein